MRRRRRIYLKVSTQPMVSTYSEFFPVEIVAMTSLSHYPPALTRRQVLLSCTHNSVPTSATQRYEGGTSMGGKI